MSVLEIIIVVCFGLGVSLYLFLAIWDLKHPERREEKKRKRLEKKEEKKARKNETDDNETGMY